MKRYFAAAVAGLTLFAAAGLVAAADAPVIRLVNAHWWAGDHFTTGERYLKGGVFVRRTRADRTVDLGGAWVTPPFGEAHNHNLAAPDMARAVSDTYLADGIFYVKNPNSRYATTPATRALLGRQDTVDAVFAMGGITSPGGHPIRLYGFLSRWSGPARDGETFEGDAFHLVSKEADIAPVLDTLQAQGADFIKTYLLHSERFEARKGQKAFYGQTGLDPKLYPLIIRAAHARGLRVSVHIESAADFRLAVAAGVDEINHLPGYMWDKEDTAEAYRLRPADARAAAGAGVVVVTTTVVTEQINLNAARKAEVKVLQAENLKTLAAAGVKIAIGSDTFMATSRAEAMNLIAIGAFDGPTVLRLWIDTAPLTIFPSRRIGCLKVGCEADFLVLGGDPLVNFSATADIRQAWKDGRTLTLPRPD